ncbi:hypothetical protein LSH36_256g01027, partial [Paralvinella palmiformis]
MDPVLQVLDGYCIVWMLYYRYCMDAVLYGCCTYNVIVYFRSTS